MPLERSATRRRSSAVTALASLALAATFADCATLAIALSRPGFAELHPTAIALLSVGGLPLALAARGVFAVVWLAAVQILTIPGQRRPYRPGVAIGILAVAAIAGSIGAWSNVG